MSDLHLPQKFYDENRELFGAESGAFDLDKQTGCGHYFIRKAYSQIECSKCHTGYLDQNRLILQDGKIVGVK